MHPRQSRRFRSIRPAAFVPLAALLAVPLAAGILARSPRVPAPLGQQIVYYGSDSWLGVGLADLDAARAKQLGLESPDGAEIKEVLPGGPAAAAGLRTDDIIVRYDGQPVRSVAELSRMVRETPPNRTVDVGVLRAGRRVNVSVKIGHSPGVAEALRNGEWGSMPAMPPMPPMAPMPPMPPMPKMPAVPPIPALPAEHFSFDFGFPAGATLGITIENIPAQLAHYFGAPGPSAVLVREVSPGSIAETAGFAAGDVVADLDGTSVANVDQFDRALRRHESEKMSVTVIRKGERKSLSVPALTPRGEGTGALGREWQVESGQLADYLRNVAQYRAQFQLSGKLREQLQREAQRYREMKRQLQSERVFID